MKQVVRRLRDGRVELIDAPIPELDPAGVLVDVRASLISAGTERSKVIAGQQSLLAKARSRPDQVRQVIEKARRDGLRETWEAVGTRLDHPEGLGYSTAGIVLAAGARVRDLAPGDRVACGGAGYASHAEINHVPANLCVPLPAGLSFSEGSFATLGAIALHGVRQADSRLGERVAVIGLGLVGQLAGRLLRAAGCVVVGVDLDPDLVAQALAGGTADAGYLPDALQGELPSAASDCDAVVIAAATRSSDPIALAARLCRDRGRVVVVGDVGLSLERGPFYDKEIDLRLSRSYGPGRYDHEYEERGLDYPIGYVRWTERRNMAAFLELLAAGRLAVGDLITRRVPLEEAPAAYEHLLEAERSPLAVVLDYSVSELPAARAAATPAAGDPRVAGVIGAGNFANRVVLPGLRAAGFELRAVASAKGLSAKAAADRYSIPHVAAAAEVIADPEVGLIAVTTRHTSHAALARQALEAGKAVFVEKPPFTMLDDYHSLRRAQRPLLVGFNRRHAPLAARLQDHVRGLDLPISLLYRVNAGRLPPDHWLNDLEDGGGRLVGEGCHFVDFACWLIGHVPTHVSCSMAASAGAPLAAAQTFSVAMDFADGSSATVLYSAAGAPGAGKEYIEAHCDERSAVLDDFRHLKLIDGRRTRTTRSRLIDKGHSAQFRHLFELLNGSAEATQPDPLDSMAVTLAAVSAAEGGQRTATAEFLA
jgi:predicted dehydrogenase